MVRKQQFRLWQAQTVTGTVHVMADQEAEDTHLLNSSLESTGLTKTKHTGCFCLMTLWLLFFPFTTVFFFFFTKIQLYFKTSCLIDPFDFDSDI